MSTKIDYDKISLKYFISNIGVLGDLSTLSSVKKIYNQTNSYDDEVEVQTLDGNLSKVFQNFYEIFINDRPLSFILDEYFENKTPIIYNWVGMIGAFRKKLDLITIKLLLKQEVEKSDVILLYSKNKELKKTEINQIIEEYGPEIDQYFEECKNENIHIYGCPKCGEREHGGYFVNVKKEKGYYQWEFYNKNNLSFTKKHQINKKNEKDKLTIKFEENQYINTFYNYLKIKNS
ncbi:hypothetical protein [Tenacibaculum sp. nBUS_03]|uniref:hypothetical protein n=1 Tax=Tenacibaculum sp. nBUS_03 TaxID=3395320 RepID=UPI003EBA6CFA